MKIKEILNKKVRIMPEVWDTIPMKDKLWIALYNAISGMVIGVGLTLIILGY